MPLPALPNLLSSWLMPRKEAAALTCRADTTLTRPSRPHPYHMAAPLSMLARTDAHPTLTTADLVGTPLGKCECFHWQRFSLKPTRFMTVADSEVCFTIARWPAGTGTERRCVYLDISVAPYGIFVERDNEVVTEVTATVGQELELSINALDLNVAQAS